LDAFADPFSSVGLACLGRLQRKQLSLGPVHCNDWPSFQGLLLVFILGGGVQSNVLEQEANMTRTKAYLTFILCFVALLNIMRFVGSTMYLTIRLFTGA
jgi:hypothetical protein